jgi:transcription elongation GreA/GreB family factor
MDDEPTTACVVAAHGEWLDARIADLAQGVAAAKDGMRVDGDHRPASRGERGAVSSQGALRAGLLSRIAELEGARASLAMLPTEPRDRVGLGALARIDDGERPGWVAILPGGQGTEVLAEAPVTVVSLRSPLARALHGLEEGDVALLQRPGGEVELEVLAVR